jgi:hypothetical protein
VSDELTEAERGIREGLAAAARYGATREGRQLGLVMAELDRLRAVERAADALIERLPHDAYVAHGVDPVSRAIVPGSCVKCDLLDALNGETT